MNFSVLLLVVSIVLSAIGALLAFGAFGTATVPQLIGLGLASLVAFAAAHLPI